MCVRILLLPSMVLMLLVAMGCASRAESDFLPGEQAYLNGDYATALARLQPLAEEGHPVAMFYVGRMYERGRGVPENLEEARTWYEAAATAGVNAAQNNLGIMYRDGHGVAQDLQRAAELFRQAALQGNDDAQLSLGALYVNGQDVPRDYPEAYGWYTLAMEQGNEHAARNRRQLEDWMNPQELAAARERVETLRADVHAHLDAGMTSPEESQGAALRTDDWATYQGAAFTLRHPQGWHVQPAETGAITLESPTGEQVILWPLFLRQGLTPSGASRVVEQVARQLRPGVRWEVPRMLQGRAVRVVGRSGHQAAVASLAWGPAVGGTGGFFSLVSAPADRLREQQTLYAGILQSFRIRPAEETVRSRPRRPAVPYVRWQDPNEQAFSLEVPQGWQVMGGLFRFAAVDVRTATRVTSPDGQIRLFIGDSDLPPFVLPTPLLQSTGFTEGSWYSPGYGVQMQVRRYLPGVAFARTYVPRVAQGCGEVQITEERQRPDAAQAINDIVARYGAYVQQRLETGEVAFTCHTGQQTMAGYTFAGTLITQSMDGGGIWNVSYLYGFVAPQARAAEARAILAHMVASVRINPQWAQMQNTLTGNVSKITTETGAYVSNLIQESWENQQRVQDDAARKWSNYIAGLEDVRDPATGTVYKVESGTNYQWIDNLGTIIGTDLADNPDPLRFRQMVRLD